MNLSKACPSRSIAISSFSSIWAISCSTVADSSCWRSSLASIVSIASNWLLVARSRRFLVTNTSKSAANLSASSNPNNDWIASKTPTGGVSCSANSLTCSPSNKNRLEIPSGKRFSIYSSQVFNRVLSAQSLTKIPNVSLPSLGLRSQYLTIRISRKSPSSATWNANSIRALSVGRVWRLTHWSRKSP